MLYIEELVCVSYLLVSSCSLFYQLRTQSFVTVECGDVWVFCLEDDQHKASMRYLLNDREVESRCNAQGSSALVCFLVISLTFLEIVIFVVVIYAQHLQIKRGDIIIPEKLILRLIFMLVTISGILVCLLVLLPLVQYYTLSKANVAAQGGFFNKVLNSPLRTVLYFIITVITSPLKFIFHGQFTINLGFDEVRPNFTCVDPILDRVTNALTCPTEGSGKANTPAPSACMKTFFCTDECQVVFPRIIINSLGVIVASFALCYRLLQLHSSGARSERPFVGQAESKVSVSTVANEHRSGAWNSVVSKKSDSLKRRKMKDKAVGCSMPAASSDFQGQNVYQASVDGCRNGKNHERTVRGNFDRNGYEYFNGIVRQECNDVCRSRGTNGDNRTEIAKNTLLRKVPYRDSNSQSIEGREKRSSSEDIGEGILLVEDESEYYMSGFRL